MSFRRDQIRRNIGVGNAVPVQAGPRHAPGSGGTSAPGSAGGGPQYGLGTNKTRGGVGPARALTGGPATPGGLAGPTPAPAQPTPMPWDVQSANDEAGALKRRSDTLTSLDAAHFRSQQDFGLEGTWADYATNPYSQAALLQRSYDTSQRGSKNSYAAQGQLYAGSLTNARNANTHQYQLGRNDLQSRAAEEAARYQSERTGAQDAYNEALSEAAWGRIQAGLDSEPDASAAPAAGGGGKKKRKKGGGGNGGAYTAGGAGVGGRKRAR